MKAAQLKSVAAAIGPRPHLRVGRDAELPSVRNALFTPARFRRSIATGPARVTAPASRLAPLLLALALASVAPSPPALAAASHPPGRAKAAPAARQSPAAQAVTQFRRENGLGPVADDPVLLRAAQRQADAMAAAGVMSHDVAGGFSERMKQAGIKAGAAAENVAMGQRSLAEVMEDWKSSSGHRRNMLMASATRIGVAQRSAGGRLYWAMVLAAPEPVPRAPGQPQPMVWGSPFPFFR